MLLNFYRLAQKTTPLPPTNVGFPILRLQPRDKAAMLVVNTKEIFLQNLHQNRVHFPAERNSFVFDHQHGCRDVTCKQAIAQMIGFAAVQH